MGKIPAHIVWPGMVMALLGMSITMVTITVVAAVGDPSFAVEADYYERAVNWDEHKAQQARNEELGWRVGVRLGEVGDAGEPGLIVSVTDSAGAPIEGATVTGDVFHYAHSKSAHEVEFSGTGAPGEYAGVAMLDRAGRWQLALRVENAGEVFTHERELELGTVGG